MTKEEDSRNILIGESRLCGKGVFAARVLEKGETILEFTGNEIDVEQALNKGEKSGNPLQVGPDLYVDLEPPGVFINHSCDPNTGILNNRTLIALRKIHQGEEIFYDYSTTMGDGLWTMNCLCGTQKCRGIITDFRHLPPPSQRAYLDAGIVQSYLVEELMHDEAPQTQSNQINQDAQGTDS